ncbi:MAG TPA: CoA transferase [Acidimicrobiales bacterium]|nr:CoA transferase [Acidimicrobiales bacterium]
MEEGTGPAAPGALDGLRVVDLSHYVAGPVVAMVLGDLGADVVRVDPPGGPLWQHPANALVQRGKRSIVLDLHDESDRAVARGLVVRADVVVESFRRGDADRAGLGPADNLAANPRLVHLSVPGFAGDDPRAWMGGWEAIVLAAAGIVPAIRGVPGNRHFQAHTLASTLAAAQATHRVLAALIARERSGRGGHVEVPLFDAAVEIVAAPRPAAGLPHLGHYRAADGRWLQLGLDRPDQRARLAREASPGEAIISADRWASLIRTRPAREWERLANERAGAPAAAVQTTREWLYDDAHARASGAVIELTDPELGPTAQAGYPFGLGATPPRARGPRRPLDGDREAILAELAAPRPAVPAGSPVPVGPGDALGGVVVADRSDGLAGATAARVLAGYGARVVRSDAPEADVVHGAAPDTVAGRPDAVCSAISAYGASGPRAGWPAGTGVAEAATGMQPRWSGPDDPGASGYALAELGAGHWSAVAQLVALYHRGRTGAGQAAHASLAQAATFHQISFAVGFEGRVWAEPAGARAVGWSPFDRLYRADDRWFHVSAFGEELSKRLVLTEGLEGVDLDAGDERLARALETAFAGAPATVWVERLRAAGVPAHVVATGDELRDQGLLPPAGDG